MPILTSMKRACQVACYVEPKNAAVIFDGVGSDSVPYWNIRVEDPAGIEPPLLLEKVQRLEEVQRDISGR
jgi:hypothetical protein